MLAALALAVDQERPGYVTGLLPRPAAGLGHRLVDMLQTEMVRAWSAAGPPVSPATILGPLNALEQVRQAIDRHEVRQLESQIDASEPQPDITALPSGDELAAPYRNARWHEIRLSQPELAAGGPPTGSALEGASLM